MASTEATVQIFEEIEAINLKLNQLGFRFIENFSVYDYYFSKYSIEELKEMEYKEILDNSLIVRKFFDDEKVIEQKIVHKNKQLDDMGNVISDNKVEVFVDNIEKTINLLKNCGLTLWCEMKNYVSTFVKDDIRIDIHEIEDLGTFIELEEYDEIKDLPSEIKFEKLSNYLKTLNLKMGKDFSIKKVFMKFNKEKN